MLSPLTLLFIFTSEKPQYEKIDPVPHPSHAASLSLFSTIEIFFHAKSLFKSPVARVLALSKYLHFGEEDFPKELLVAKLFMEKK